MSVVTVVGARPQFIKAAVVSRAFMEVGVAETLVHTGQHYDSTLSDVFFDELDLPAPAHHLGIGNLSHGAMTGRMIEALEQVLVKVKPRVVLVYGDTNSTLAAALAAAKLNIDVAHVEAGMRSFNRAMPEEINRVLTDHVARLNFVTGPAPRELLRAEGVTLGVHEVGDVMLDAFVRFEDAASRSSVRAELGLNDRGYALATLHRAENTGSRERLVGILEGLSRVAERLPVVMPLHPRTTAAVARYGLAFPAGVQVVEPVGYLAITDLERHAAVVITDSGGMQKEAFFARVPCITLRDETEWRETVDRGCNTLVGADADAIAAQVSAALSADRGSYDTNVFGDGHAAVAIAEHIVGHLAAH